MFHQSYSFSRLCTMTSNALRLVRANALALLEAALERFGGHLDIYIGVSPPCSLDLEKRRPRATGSLLGQLGIYVIWRTGLGLIDPDFYREDIEKDLWSYTALLNHLVPCEHEGDCCQRRSPIMDVPTSDQGICRWPFRQPEYLDTLKIKRYHAWMREPAETRDPNSSPLSPPLRPFTRTLLIACIERAIDHLTTRQRALIHDDSLAVLFDDLCLELALHTNYFNPFDEARRLYPPIQEKDDTPTRDVDYDSQISDILREFLEPPSVAPRTRRPVVIDLCDLET